MAPKIVPLLPPHTVYVEPFFGSGAVMFEKGIPSGSTIHYREVINDKNDLLIGFFRVLQDPEQNKALYQRLEFTLYSRAEYKRALELCKNPVADSVLMAWAWFINISMSFARKADGGWGYALNSESLAHTFQGARGRIPEYCQRFQGVHIESADALEVIRRWDTPYTLHYIDPPYPGTEQGHYGGFTQADFEALIETLKTVEGSVVLSCYNNAAVPVEWEKHEFTAVASSRGVTGKSRNHSEASTARDDAGRTECVWIKPAAGDVNPELKAAMIRHEAQRRQLSLFEEVSA